MLDGTTVDRLPRRQAEPLGADRRAHPDRPVLVPPCSGGQVMKRLNRRTLLRGAGGLALSLPLLEAMLPSASAQEVDTPRRILFEFKANGDQTARRFTATGETTFAFDEFLA